MHWHFHFELRSFHGVILKRMCVGYVLDYRHFLVSVHMPQQSHDHP